jgi:hypothetical protein
MNEDFEMIEAHEENVSADNIASADNITSADNGTSADNVSCGDDVTSANNIMMTADSEMGGCCSRMADAEVFVPNLSMMLLDESITASAPNSPVQIQVRIFYFSLLLYQLLQ